MESNELNEKGLYKLKDLKDYEVAKSDPDVRDWNVYSSDKKLIGTVEELIVDPELMKVRYLNVLLNEGISRENENRFMLIPIGAAELDERKEAVYITNIETVTLLKIPGYSGENITRDYEKNVRRIIKPDEIISEFDTDFYNNDLFNEEKFYGSRRTRLYKLKEMDTRAVLGNKPDVRGWNVITSDGIEIGRIDELLVDQDNKVRYLDIQIREGTVFNESSYILVPIGLASLGVNKDIVVLNMKSTDFANYPTFNGEIVTRGYEASIFNTFRGENEFSKTDDERHFYEHEHYKDDRFFSGEKSNE